MNSTATNQIAKHWGGGWGARPRSSTYGVEPSWEEQAFARDAAGYLGGGVWPPRSYSCSFCRREFRSAQALGGHMNVHRRDRARLRQASSDDVQDAHQLPHYRSLSATNHDQAHHHSALLYSALLSNSKEVMTSSPPPSYISNIINESKNVVFVSRSEAQAEAIQCDDDDDEEAARRKRRRVARHPVVVLPFFVRPAAAAAAAGCEREELRGAHDDAKVPKTVTSPSSSSFLAGQQEVDLELRLGNS